MITSSSSSSSSSPPLRLSVMLFSIVTITMLIIIPTLGVLSILSGIGATAATIIIADNNNIDQEYGNDDSIAGLASSSSSTTTTTTANIKTCQSPSMTFPRGGAVNPRGGTTINSSSPPKQQQQQSLSDGLDGRMREQRRRRRGYLTTTDENGENGNNNGNNGGNGDKNNRGDNKGQGNDNKDGKSDEPPPLIVTVDLPRQGKTDGVREGGVDAWRGVPFATPPVGTLRFSPPSPPVPWSPARHDASRFGPDCHQPLGPENPGATVEHMSEDCLYVNVLTPAGHSRRARPGWVAGGAAPLPVMVWIHGGAFRQGSGAREEYDGRRLAERDLVVVTFNYRLGALGFLVSLEDGLTGNYGIMDQRAALEWVNKNIRAFGGDPENVTLFGESSGAISIGLHLQMDGAGTLFHRAVMQSNPMGYHFRSAAVASFLGEAIKEAMHCPDRLCLQTERVEELMVAQEGIMGVPRTVGDLISWGPTLTKEERLQRWILARHGVGDGSSGNSGSSGSGSIGNHGVGDNRGTSPNHHTNLYSSSSSYVKNPFKMLEGTGAIDYRQRPKPVTTNNNRRRNHDNRRHHPNHNHNHNHNPNNNHHPNNNNDPSSWWGNVNITSPLLGYSSIPDNIPVIIGTNRHEGEIFVYTAFPSPMPKAMYWTTVGAFFRLSSGKILKHYRGLVDMVEAEAEDLASKQIEEEECRQEYLENRERYDREYEVLRMANGTTMKMKRGDDGTTTKAARGDDDEGVNNKAGQQPRRHGWNAGLEDLQSFWTSGGYQDIVNGEDSNVDGNELIDDDEETNGYRGNNNDFSEDEAEYTTTTKNDDRLVNLGEKFHNLGDRFHIGNREGESITERIRSRARDRDLRRMRRMKARALREAARVVVDYRPVLSAIINDYLFRCPSWHFAQVLSGGRKRRFKKKGGDDKYDNNNDDDDGNANYNRGNKYGSGVTNNDGGGGGGGKRGGESDGKGNKSNSRRKGDSGGVYVYRFSQPTHIPGYKACWGKSCHTAELPYVFQSMDILRSNYSTVGPHAQDEAPSAPEYPYTQIMAAYRGALEAFDNGTSNGGGTGDAPVLGEVGGGVGEDEGNGGGFGNRTQAFQAILNHFFGDFFKHDADEELANDMAERWASFAKGSDPNYEGSKTEWLPWRHGEEMLIPPELNGQGDSDDVIGNGYVTATGKVVGWEDESNLDSYDSKRSENDNYGSTTEKDYDSWDEHFDYDMDESDPELDHYLDIDEFDDALDDHRRAREKFYRRRGLEALGTVVAEEDVFRTELRREPSSSSGGNGGKIDELDRVFLKRKRLFRHSLRWSGTEDGKRGGDSRRKFSSAAREAVRLAQELGVLGTGLQDNNEGGERGHFHQHHPDPFSPQIPFFPEILELSWPPEGRIIEKDCTCDLWDTIRYRY